MKKKNKKLMADKKLIIFENNNNKKCIFISIICFFLVLIISLVLLITQKYAPFGDNCFAWMDGNIQYLDFFSYLKDVLDGKNSIGFSFSNMLGNSSVGVLGYYLSSPINILLYFFNKNNIPTFFNIAVIIKLSLAGLTFSYYLQKRFNYKIKEAFIIVLSLCYALMQYNMAQASNIMWLDGVYLLPLILLGVYKLVKYKNIRFLSISITLSVIFNWYTGGINCLFSAFWFLVEEVLENVENTKSTKEKIKVFTFDLMKYILSMIIGIMISAILFLPNILVLRNGRGSGFDWDFLKFGLMGNVILSIQNYIIGSVSTQSRLSIFCGSIPLIGCILFFTSKVQKFSHKVILGIILFICIMFCYWQPFVFIFSLLKCPLSYYFRYSYIVIFTFIFAAANAYKNIENEGKNTLIISSITISIIIVIINYWKKIYEFKYIYITVGFIMLNAIFLKTYLKDMMRKKDIFIWIIVILTIVELMYNAKILMQIYGYSDVSYYNSYQKIQQEQINKIKEFDRDNYRISQTSTRNTTNNGLTLNYNEALAFNYMSNTSYTSTPDNNQLEFLNKLGYRTEGNNTSIVNTSVIGADALLGVKYILSSYDIKGLNKVEDIPNANGKNVYENPYSLNLAYLIPQTIDKNIEYINPFQYQNELFSILANKKVDVYKSVSIDRIEKSNTEVRYNINIPKGNYVLYGNLPWSEVANETLDVNNRYKIGYACSMSQSVFYIPYDGNEAYVEVTSDRNLSIFDEQFYILDLDILKNITEEINKNKVNELKIHNNEISCTVQSDKNQNIIVLIPYLNGFNIYRNNEQIQPNIIENCFMEIPIIEGMNEIKIKYKIPGLKLGICISILGTSILILYTLKERRYVNIKN